MELYPSKSVVILLLIVGEGSAWCARNDVVVAAIGLGSRTVEGIFYRGYQGGNHNPLGLRATGLETIRTEQGDGGGSWQQVVELSGYVIILVENVDGKIKLYGSPPDRDNLEVGDEILEVNGLSLDNISRTDIIRHIHD
uniref:PDZ domain-containing protein n=1 Tax=Glossina pallidipes TaxID=7398 RepID=A0A1B0A159_GLOPL